MTRITTSLARLLPLFFLSTSTAFVFTSSSSFSPFVATLVSPAFAVTSCSSSSSALSSSSSSSEPQQTMSTPRWYQKEITITAPSRGCHLITRNVQEAVKNELPNIKIGMANLFIQHTSASLTVNENADPDVRRLVTTS